MEYLGLAYNFLAHLDVHLASLAQNYGGWVYLILFLIIFAETGVVVTPFLPGDSLLFVAGAVAAVGMMGVNKLVAILILAAFLGNYVNFQIGKYLGKRFFIDRESRFLKREYLDRTHAFFERHGGKTIIISRFLPIIRTYAPFVAGIGRMGEWRFALYNAAGAILWVASLTYAGYLFGNIPIIKNNLTIVILAIIVISLLPGAIAYLRTRATPA
ncbi:MAG: DedA family protein [Burkholderiales bacterium]